MFYIGKRSPNRIFRTNQKYTFSNYIYGKVFLPKYHMKFKGEKTYFLFSEFLQTFFFHSSFFHFFLSIFLTDILNKAENLLALNAGYMYIIIDIEVFWWNRLVNLLRKWQTGNKFYYFIYIVKLCSGRFIYYTLMR